MRYNSVPLGVMQMLEMHASCERCGRSLPAESTDAVICSFECTFCAACAQSPLAGKCPNCGGALERRPTRMPGKAT